MVIVRDQLFDWFLQVPSLNDVPLHYLKSNSLVKFRCMVQDMFDPEFFMGVYEINDPTSNSKVSTVSNRTNFCLYVVVLLQWNI